MAQFFDKCIVFLFIILLQTRNPMTIYSVLPVLIGLSTSLAVDITKKEYKWIPYLCFMMSCILLGDVLYFLPLLVYDMYKDKTSVYVYIPFLFILIYKLPNQFPLWIMLIIASIVAMILKTKHIHSCSVLDLYKKQRDNTKELTLLLEDRNRDLLLKQDYEIRLATLNERNRIAREIHDNVGHLLSSSLLQVGALQAINTQDTLQEPLRAVHSTLDQAMNSIRSSVHGLHDDALALDVEIQKLLDTFTFCKSTLTYDVEHPLQKEVNYHLISIVKEAMNNVIKHSNATQFNILIREQPKLYQVILHDNGTAQHMMDTGIGLYNMRQRVEQIHGYIHISHEQGFRIFITLPKEKEICV